MPKAQTGLTKPHEYLIPSAVASAALALVSGAAHFLSQDGRPPFLLYVAGEVILFLLVALAVLSATSRALDYLIEVKKKSQRLRGKRARSPPDQEDGPATGG